MLWPLAALGFHFKHSLNFNNIRIISIIFEMFVIKIENQLCEECFRRHLPFVRPIKGYIRRNLGIGLRTFILIYLVTRHQLTNLSLDCVISSEYKIANCKFTFSPICLRLLGVDLQLLLFFCLKWSIIFWKNFLHRL